MEESVLGKIYNALEKADKNEKINSEELHDSYEKIEGSPKIGAPKPDNEKLITISEPYSPLSEQFRILKNNILFPESGYPPRTIMITSASPSEGKSFVSANLACIMAQSVDEYVLLVDCDLRKPTIHSLFGYTDRDTKGLSDHLSDNISLQSVLKRTTLNKLTLLPAGKIPKNPSELISSEQMRRMLHEVKLRYNDRYIIIDTPPPYITSETNAIARHVDAIVIVVKHGKTRLKEVEDIIDIFGKEKIIGVVKNFSLKSFGYGYGYNKYGYHQNK